MEHQIKRIAELERSVEIISEQMEVYSSGHRQGQHERAMVR
jgi:hypothetical protein